ncbi:alcohol dehydrogenase catalytic domain-containing protein [Acetohalobium arabaticum]|uniref:Alcohol dehydrogenase GroES domain protein n=1 Tax=Acetohalobium arabaticum (strain ATCC 49924 / DSM 5501 / Z-7288) TaxID=574087 RepID=D9QT06_ACEAZ|nr:alcohol dehydrogenase catalytic domain-containing protein [Acetohalobium arabaticum]ADL13506.1 Alcohol dehydrogenase GroES domain protein [Acetohalobium arabaticum DSM 5501]
MKAAVLKGQGEFNLADVEDTECPPGGVIVKVKSAGICSADVRMICQGHKALDYPRIPGHEVAGIVAENRAAGSEFEVGDRVQIAPEIICNECSYCREGITNQCEDIGIMGFTHDGGFAEYIMIPPAGVESGILNPIPVGLSFMEATLAEPLACSINAQELARVSKGDRVLVIGAGVIGCLHTMLAKANGAQQVLIADKLTSRINLAEQTEANCFIDLSIESIEEAVTAETENKGVDVIILACEEAALSIPLFKLLAPRGRISFFSSLPYHQSNIELDANELHYKEQMIVGAYGCRVDQNKKALELMTKELEVDWLITDEISLDEIRTGIERLINYEGLKTVINF